MSRSLTSPSAGVAVAVDPDFVFIVAYECPRCRAPLEARVSGPPTWLRCPECGRAGLPPEHMRGPRPPVEARDPMVGTFTTNSGASALPIRPRAMAPRPELSGPKASTSRVMLGSAFFLSVCLTLISLLSSHAERAAIFGVASAIFLFLLSRPVASRE